MWLRKFQEETWKLFILNKEVRAKELGHGEDLKFRSTTGVLGHPCNFWFDLDPADPVCAEEARPGGGWVLGWNIWLNPGNWGDIRGQALPYRG